MDTLDYKRERNVNNAPNDNPEPEKGTVHNGKSKLDHTKLSSSLIIF